MDVQFEFDEPELRDSKGVAIPKPKHQKPNSLPLKRPIQQRSASSAADRQTTNTVRSVPVNVPDWSKILPHEHNADRRGDCDDADDSDDNDEGSERLPPHEYLARTRTQSLSVHEGVGRTLKGRDLSTVRDTIWKQIGFE